jgi:CelD/BcsL family acetyltransferase involved in cellulose biosynthesis
MADRIATIDPRTSPEWEEFVLTRPDATVFHTAAWCKVVADTYRYTAPYVVARDEQGRITGGVPLMVVESWLSGRRLVGLPFSDICAPLLPANGREELLEAARDEVARLKATSVELRGPSSGGMPDCGFSNGTVFFRHVIDLDDQMESRVESSARRAIRKAEKEGVTIRESAEPADMRRFYNLMVMTRRKHGLLPQPRRFFEKIHAQFMEPGQGQLLLAEHGGKVSAGDLLLRFRDQLVYKFNASDPRFLGLRPNNLLLWKAMQSGRDSGCRTLDLGRCEEDNEGLRRFKLLWGGREERLPYYQYPAEANGSAVLGSRRARAALSLFVKLAPGFAVQAAGSALYRNFG